MVQLSTPQETYLGLTIIPSYKSMTLDRKHQIQCLTVPSTREEILSFLGIAGFLCSWIPSFFLLAHTLTSHTITKPFQELQQALLQALALHLSDFTLKEMKKDIPVGS